MRLIGINGFKGSGKDTVYKTINHIVGDVLTVQRIAFADKMKIIAAKSLGFDRSDSELLELMDSFKNTARFHIEYTDPQSGEQTAHAVTGREYVQWFGENVRGELGENIWVDQVLPRLQPGVHSINKAWGDSLLNGPYPAVDVLCVTDVRMPHEALRVLELGGEVWRVVRPGITSDGHNTELPLAPEFVTRVLNNDGALVDLEREVQIALG